MLVPMWTELAGIAVGGSPLVLGESAARLFSLKREAARKLVHVLGAAASASLALFLSLNKVAALGVLFFGVLLLVRRYKLVTALYDVTRRTYGELLFPLGVSAAALIAKTPHVYIAALCIIGLADTAASIVGRRYGRRPIAGARSKSFEGSAAFFLVTCGILLSLFHATVYLFAVSVLLTIAEAYSDHGSDNLTVPALAAVLLGARL
jgi:phytol kinase